MGSSSSAEVLYENDFFAMVRQLKASKQITIDLLVQRVQSVRRSLTDRDRRLFNHAKICIAEEKERLNNCELFIDFQDQKGIHIQTKKKPSSTIFVGYDQYDNPRFVWAKRSFSRRAKYYFVRNFQSLLDAVKVAGKIAGNVLPAVTFH